MAHNDGTKSQTQETDILNYYSALGRIASPFSLQPQYRQTLRKKQMERRILMKKNHPYLIKI
jgi:hypothetical protein